MNKELQTLLALYEEPPLTDSELLQSGLIDEPGPDLDVGAKPSHESRAGEQRRLQEAKFVLENRVRVRPDASVIDSIVRAANADGGGARRSSGPAMRLVKGLTMSSGPMRYAVAASVVLFAVVVGVSQLGGPSGLTNEADSSPSSLAESKKKMDADNEFAAKDEAAPAAPAASGVVAEREEFRQDLQSNPAPVLSPARRLEVSADQSTGFSRQARGARSQLASAEADSLPGWDDETRMRTIQRRIESLGGADAVLAWDQPAVPLEQMVRMPVQPGVLRARSEQQ